MSVKDLYKGVILDHYRNPRNFRRLDQANGQAEGINPLCGDRLSIYVQIEDDTLKDIGFTGSGCAISIAATSLMTESVKFKTIEEAKAISEDFCRLVAHGSSTEKQQDSAIMGKLSIFSGVRGYPARIKCATLPWKTLGEALESVSSRQHNE
jgi:nitrogen fixation NifU-like protein